ncbi:MAG TPA: VOC family protein [Rhodospirillaceae bacterium]|nr:VOC family protein [Rhodospirillaceae bacterium]
MGNPFVHVELSTTNLAKAKTFYQAAFDWKLEEMPADDGMAYTMINVGDGTGGGMMEHAPADGPSAWLPYVMVADIKRAVESARALGATIKVEPAEVKDYGWYAVIIDPTGATLGLWMNNPGKSC